MIIIEQAKAMASAGQVNDAEELLNKLINHIKSKAAVNESGGFGMLELALDTLSGLYIKSGAYARAEANMSELVTLRENARGAGDSSLATTYRQYAKVLRLLNRANEAATYEARAEAKLEPKVEASAEKIETKIDTRAETKTDTKTEARSEIRPEVEAMDPKSTQR